MIQQQTKRSLPPLVKTITVPLSVEHAFRRFTEEIATWWPLETHSVGEKNAATVTFECKISGQIFETLKSGETSLWGTVQEWEPPNRVVFSWHPGGEPSSATEVEITFSDRDGQTEVMVTHSGWETFGEKAEETRGGYDKGWDLVLGKYVQ